MTARGITMTEEAPIGLEGTRKAISIRCFAASSRSRPSPTVNRARNRNRAASLRPTMSRDRSISDLTEARKAKKKRHQGHPLRAAVVGVEIGRQSSRQRPADTCSMANGPNGGKEVRERWRSLA